MKKFPSIKQYRNAISAVRQHAQYVGDDENGEPICDRSVDMPVLKMIGTVKLHGTNAAIVRTTKDKSITYQSRERELSLTEDNAGFMMYMSKKTDIINSMFDRIMSSVPVPLSIAIYGEWCGGNVQPHVALNQLPKMFVIFGIKAYHGETDINGDEVGVWLDTQSLKHVHSAEDKIFNIYNFPTFEVEIDFNHPELVTNKIVEMTIAVENECPVAKQLGATGIGEGLVFAPAFNEGSEYQHSCFWFKSKGEKHSASKCKKLMSVDVESIQAIKEFCEYAVTDARLEQGLNNLMNEQLKPFEMTSMGDFIRWVYNDIVKEETDTIVENQLDMKKLGGPIANISRKWYTEKYNNSPL